MHCFPICQTVLSIFMNFLIQFIHSCITAIEHLIPSIVCFSLRDIVVVVVVQSWSHVLLLAAPWTAACEASLSYTVSWYWLKFMSIELVMPSNHLIFCYPLLFCFQSLGFPCGSAGKESACNVGDLGLIRGLGRSPEEGKGYPLQYFGLVNSIDYTDSP